MPEFQHDLFISYAHIDNESLGGRAQGWVSDLHEALRVRLSQLLGEPPEIWRDEKLGRADFFDDEIRVALTSAAAMLAILSPRYLRSDSCQQEVREFLAQTERQGGMRVGNKSRLLKAIKTPVAQDEHPPAIQGLLGFDFFEVERNGVIREYYDLYGPEWGLKFWQTLEDLAQELCQLFKVMRAEDGEAHAPSAEGLTIYLGQATNDLRELREAMRRDLQQRGHTVLPELPLPLIGPKLETQVAADLARSRLALHLLGETYGVVPEAAARSAQEIENLLAAQRSRAEGLPRLIWAPPGAAPEDARQRDFLDSLRNDADPLAGAELLEAPIEEFRAVLLDRLAQLQQPRAPQADEAGDDRLTRLYLIYDERDEEKTAPLEDYLWSAHDNIEIVRPLFSGDPSLVRDEHEENLRICQGALLYFGQSDEAWLRTKLRDLRRALGLGRRQPIYPTGVYVAPPLNPRKARFRTREVDFIIHASNGFEPVSLDGFMAQLASSPPSQPEAAP